MVGNENFCYWLTDGIKYINSLRICDIVHYFNQNSVENQQKIMASYDDFHG